MQIFWMSWSSLLLFYVAVQGQYSYNSPEGPVSVQYIADEHGYQPSGPNIHPAILKAVAEQVAEARSKPPGANY